MFWTRPWLHGHHQFPFPAVELKNHDNALVPPRLDYALWVFTLEKYLSPQWALSVLIFMYESCKNFQQNIGLSVPWFLWCSISSPFSPHGKSVPSENNLSYDKVAELVQMTDKYVVEVSARMFMLAKQNMTHIDIELHFRKLDGDIFCFYGKRRSFFEPINDIWSTNISKWVLLS